VYSFPFLQVKGYNPTNSPQQHTPSSPPPLFFSFGLTRGDDVVVSGCSKNVKVRFLFGRSGGGEEAAAYPFHYMKPKRFIGLTRMFVPGASFKNCNVLDPSMRKDVTVYLRIA